MPSSEPTGGAGSRNPSYLLDRYEIRRLGPEHAEWAKAIVLQTNFYNSPLWPLIYLEDSQKLAVLHEGMDTMTYLVVHQIESGLSFDTEYKFKRQESETLGGKLYWNKSETANAAEILNQMDFPLVSVALAYDQNDPLDMEQMMSLVQTLPLFGTFYHAIGSLDKRDPETWVAKGPKQVLMRNATSTREDYAGKGIMKKLAQFLMREAKLEGYRGIQIECMHDKVTQTWLHPPKPFRGESVAILDVSTYRETNDKGEVSNPFSPATQISTKVYVHL